MKNKRLFLIFLMSIIGIVPVFANVTAEQILKKSDEVRNPQLDYVVHVKVTDYQDGKPKKESTFKTMVKGRDKSVVQTLTPIIDRGRVLLMAENNFWGYLPNVSKPLRISLQEKLTGEVANGDLARVNYAGDYVPTIKSVKTIKGVKYYVMNLKAKRKDLTYGSVVLWVKDQGFHPHYAEFFATSGRKLKTCRYEGFKPFGGAVRPTKLIMSDAVNEGQMSVLEYSSIQVSPLPDKYFTKDYMKRLP